MFTEVYTGTDALARNSREIMDLDIVYPTVVPTRKHKFQNTGPLSERQKPAALILMERLSSTRAQVSEAFFVKWMQNLPQLKELR